MNLYTRKHRSERAFDLKDYNQVLEAARRRNLFAAGIAAMTIDNHTMMDDIQRFAPEMNWGVVTVPVDPATPNQTFSMKPWQIYSIYSGSAVIEEAWDVFRFINGDEMATMKSRTQRFDRSLPIRTAYIPNDEDERLAAFYKLNVEDRAERSLILPLEFHQ